MAIFPLLWLAAAAIALLCVLAGFDEVLLVQWVLTCLYLLSLIRWRRRRRVAVQAAVQQAVTDGAGADPDLPAGSCTDDGRFGGDAPDELQKRLHRKAMQMEQRKIRLQIATL